MQVTVLGGCGAWPSAGQACSGYLVEHGGYRPLVDPGYATLPRLLAHVDASDVDAVLVTHGHPDHCADINPLLRAGCLRPDPAPPLPAYALPGALDAVLALDARMVARTRPVRVHDLMPGERFAIGPFTIETRMLPHFIPNAGGSASRPTVRCSPTPAIAVRIPGSSSWPETPTYSSPRRPMSSR